MRRFARTFALVAVVLVGSLATAQEMELPPNGDFFWVDAHVGWWTDVLVLSDGQDTTEDLKALAPDALNWAFFEQPSFLAEMGTHHIRAAHWEYQESEEFTPEEEDLDDWELAGSLAYNIYDEPIYYGDWGGSYFMDPHSEPWASLVFEGIKTMLEGADGVSQDNIGVPPFIKGGGGFSPTEKQEFRTFLVETFEARALERIGIDPSTFDIAEYIRELGYTNGNREAENDPIYRAFVMYQYLSNLQIWQGMLDELDLDAELRKIVHGNQFNVWSPYDSNPYSVLLSQLHQVIEIEYGSYLQAMPPDVRDSLLYKIGLASGRHEKPVWIRGIVFDWQRWEPVLRTNHLRLIAASAYANGAVRTLELHQGTPNGPAPVPDEARSSLLQYYGWLDDVRFLFERQESIANVALVYSIPTMLWRYFPATGHWNSPQVASISGIAHVLELEHIPYDAVVFGHPSVWSDEGLADRLGQYDVLILPDVDCLSDDQLEVLENFVGEGGRLLCTGAFGVHNENLEPRISWRLALLAAHPNVLLLQGTPGRELFQESVLNGQEADPAYLSIREAVIDLLGDDTILETTAPETVSANPYRTETLYTVHLLNHNYDEADDSIESAGSFQLNLKLPEDVVFDPVSNVHLFGDDGTIRALGADVENGWLSATVPGVKLHAILCLGDLEDVVVDAAAECQAALDRNPWAADNAAIAAQIAQLQELQSTRDWATILSICETLKQDIEDSQPSVLFDFSHAQTAALDEESARSINPEHPDWHVVEGLGSYVNDQLEDGPITAKALANASALIVAPHQAAFSADEVAVVEDYVRHGGGLLFIGDGGVLPAYEDITLPFGLHMLPHSTLIAEDHLWDEVSFGVFDIVEHPITNRVENIQLNYCAPMVVDEGWQVLAWTAAEVWSEANDLEGPFPVVAYRTLGEGHIAAVCDNAPFANWGNTSLVYNLIQWLVGE